jgi:hypothetical protein
MKPTNLRIIYIRLEELNKKINNNNEQINIMLKKLNKEPNLSNNVPEIINAKNNDICNTIN